LRPGRALGEMDIHISASFAQPALQNKGTTVIVALGIEDSPGLGEVFKGEIVELLGTDPIIPDPKYSIFHIRMNFFLVIFIFFINF